ncbi:MULTISPECIES: phosphoribosylpyrophosphate synthetase [Thalassospira]|jgi:predicted ATP-grasp superfamily ATP-dependent carboligase|uniref:Phosphoribosylpyrophosphate synthetase n=1 Tax=Thalassospira povalilytica TaxID=732237 RepID=A0A8I1M4W4_9PROT|nr:MULTISPECIES: phosphoribosylpyrophosphate synthetase [Thalassospira]RCK28122.1 phosphoribosylpyrophosphate synthetase [Thalassospira profundimaris]MBN8195227.1 phosphoribosylpyrophosphate synthetase [Thalassospira povalilytica]MBO6770428.1 phosphoribosylpyrophosphate synthetase [Thalassospira sp.]MCC4239963.1 phosphoribosylpyrophosphate synthetase [Thalassospira povalilytica]PKR50003.1 phosphoribosylpyrophosphate synthetase [Thalassospira povalilytica]
MNLIELQDMARERGFTHIFSARDNHVICDGQEVRYHADDLTIVDFRSVDNGTDPGDDATLYMIEAKDGLRGMLIVPDSFHTDPDKADLVDHLRRNQS